MKLSRRGFLKLGTGTAVGATALYLETHLAFLQSSTGIENPLAQYPARDWERIYRDQYRYDSSFAFICAPNDTHMCRLRAFVRNGVVMRIEQNYDGDAYRDPQGNRSSVAWNPRACLKGFTLHRRVYGPYRGKGPALRKGWKQWADDGFPSLSDTPELRKKYRFDARGDDEFVRVSWDEANGYAARGLEAIAKAYSGEEGRRRLVEKDGYPEEMLHHWEEAGTRTMKFGSSLPPHGVAGKFGPFRFANMLALLDAKVRSVGPEKAHGGRPWSEYTWRGDQAPGFPFVHGLQSTETDFNDLRHSNLLVMIGKNLVENKMADSHWFHEIMERGGKIVSIVPEYNPPATKSDYWLSVRPGLSDTALLLGVAKAIIDRNLFDAGFVRRFTDLPLLVRLDTLQRLRADEVFPAYASRLDPSGPSRSLHSMTEEQHAQIGDRVVYDATAQALRAVTREDVGDRMEAKKIDPALDYRGTVKLVSGREVQVATVLSLYREHLKDYDLDTVTDICGAPKDLIERFIVDIATIKPAAIHIGEGINHYFHATLHNRAAYLVMMLTGNVGKYGAGVSTWAGNYKGGIFHAAEWYGPGVGGYVNEDPFNPVLDEKAPYTAKTTHEYSHGEEAAYWGFGDRPLIVDTPAEGRKVFTGQSHLPTPTKVLWYNNANLINQAKWAYHLVKNVNPKIDMIVDQQIEWTGSAEFADVILPANSWLEAKTLEMGGSCSNPFLQVWKGGIQPLNDTRDDVEIFAGVARALSDITKEPRFGQYFQFSGRPEVYLDRVLRASFTTKGYTIENLMKGEFGPPGGALFQYKSYPRVPFTEQLQDSLPFYTDTGRLNAYADIPEAIEYGENLIVHREAVEATKYLPNVIVSTSPYIRPKDYGIPQAISGGVCPFPDVDSACKAVIETVQMGVPVARIELINGLGMRAFNNYAKLGYPETPCLFVEFHGTDAGVKEEAETFGEIAAAHGGGPFRWTADADERNRLWKARHDAYWAGMTLRPGARALSTDVCVPISRLAECIVETEADIARSGLVAPIVGHVGDGNFHVLALMDMDDAREIEAVEAFVARLNMRAIAMDGTCTGEHGIGQGKMAFLPHELGAGVDVMRAIKQALDPQDIMNPGKVLPI
ncbi:MAG: nitrate oxidoreductase subunit alpha [Chloroflexi bacterium CFX7]|nr:nitrate oxidoreductase subunit alpha [Chloroflexi bacterium CFX7]